MAYPLSLKVFKHCWNQLATSYAVGNCAVTNCTITHYALTNNDAALMFRAITELVLCPPSSACATAPIKTMDSVGDRIEQMVACFPKELAPLCRELAQACINALNQERVSDEAVFTEAVFTEPGSQKSQPPETLHFIRSAIA